MPLIASSFSFGDALLTVLEVALLLFWIWIAVGVIFDIFRSRDLSNWAKALWCLFILILPLFGVLGYLIVRGHTMHEHQEEDRAQLDAFRRFTQSPAGGGGSGGSGGHANDLKTLADLKDRGVLSDEEFQRAKEKVLS
jgi:hypothetical protein